jgi:hypothetical protein
MRFATGSPASLLDLMQREAEVSLEVSDDRIFAGLWNYLVIGYAGGTAREEPSVDLIVDPWSKAEYSEVVITGSLYCDVAVRRPQLFSYSQANVFPP